MLLPKEPLQQLAVGSSDELEEMEGGAMTIPAGRSNGDGHPNGTRRVGNNCQAMKALFLPSHETNGLLSSGFPSPLNTRPHFPWNETTFASNQEAGDFRL